jgi:hypothetical protein
MLRLAGTSVAAFLLVYPAANAPNGREAIMRQTVVGVYDSYADACMAQGALIDAGFPQADISIYAMSVGAKSTRGPRVYAPGGGDVRHDAPVFDQLERLFARLFKQGEYPPETEAYREVIRRGGAIVSVDSSEGQVDLALDVMRRTGAADVEERAKAWREGSEGEHEDALKRGGPTGNEESSVYASESSAERHIDSPSAGAASRMGSESSMPGSGAERQRDDSTSASRAEQSSGAGRVGDEMMGSPLGDDGLYDDEFRRDYDARYSNSGAPYDDYRRAYKHGVALGQDERYRGRDWEQVEPGAREHWESRYPQSAWERFKAAVRHGWERVTDRRI